MGINGHRILAAAIMLCALTRDSSAQTVNVGGVELPSAIKAGNTVLLLNGSGIGTELIAKVYVIGLYLQTKTADPQALISADEGKRITITMLRDVSQKKFVQAVEKGMVRNAGPAIPTLRARLNTLEGALPALEKGDFIEFTYLPGAGTMVSGQGHQLTIPGKDFSDALFSVWMGPKASNAALRSQLLRR